MEVSSESALGAKKHIGRGAIKLLPQFSVLGEQANISIDLYHYTGNKSFMKGQILMKATLIGPKKSNSAMVNDSDNNAVDLLKHDQSFISSFDEADMTTPWKSNNKKVTLYVANINASQSGHEINLEILSSAIFLNEYVSKSLLRFDNLVFKKFQTEEQYVWKDSTVFASMMTISFDKIDVGLSPGMQAGVTIDLLTNQIAAFNAARILKLDGAGNTSTSIPVVEYTPSKLSIQVVGMSILIDAYLKGKLSHDVMKVTITDLDCFLASTKTPNDVQSEIYHFDVPLDHVHDEVPPFHYDGITGGDLIFRVKGLNAYFIPPESNSIPLIQINDAGFYGPIYSCKILDPAILNEYRMVELSDSTSHIIEVERNENQTLLSTCVVDSTVASKIYMDLVFSTKNISVSNVDESSTYVSTVLKTIAICTPPNTREFSPNLPIWDTLRYNFHGNFRFEAEIVEITFSRKDYLAQETKITTLFDLLKIHLDDSQFDICFDEMSIDVSCTSRLVARRGVHGSTTFKGESITKTNNKSFINLNVFVLPGFILSLLYSQDRFPEGFETHYGHHAVYLKPPVADIYDQSLKPFFDENIQTFVLPPPIQYINNDRFFFFRSRKMTSRWNMEIRLSDKVDKPISLNLRLDIMIRIMDIMSTNETKDNSENGSHGDDVDQDDEEQVENDLEIPKGIDRPVANVSSPFDMIHKIDIQLIINRLMLRSWPSAHHLSGILLRQELMDLQIRMVRSTIIDNNIPTALKIDHLFADIDYCEIYVRDWNLYKKNNSDPIKEDFSILLNLNKQITSSFSSPAAKRADKRKKNSKFVVEPFELKEIDSMLKPTHKFAHASKVVVTLTENGSVSSRNSTFSPTGILRKRSEREGDNLPQDVKKLFDEKKSEFLIGI